jgi:hypothetical protein
VVNVHVAQSDSPTPRSQAAGRAAQQQERDRATLAKERRIRQEERLDQYNEEYWLREQQGLSPLPALANSSSHEEESDGGRSTSDRWEPAPPSPRVEGAAVESTFEAGMEPPVARSSWRCQWAPQRRQ